MHHRPQDRENSLVDLQAQDHAALAFLSRKLDELERRVSHHDEAITSIVNAIRELATPPDSKRRRRIGIISDS